jgi:alkylation response protein AidB-like acyl-CoA dehydrogenase
MSACLALTEPAGGCNIEDSIQQGRTIRTIANLEGEEWVINGQKLWPSNAGEAEVYITLCTTDPELGNDGITILFVPKDTPGLSFGEPEGKMGLTFTDVNAAIFFEDVRVPKDYCCGAPGGEGAEILHTITNGRLEDGPLSIGAAQAALETVIEYTGERYIQGKPVRDQSMHAGILGEMAAQVQNARASYMYAASMLDRPEEHGAPNSSLQIARASAVKMYTTQVAIEVILKAIELMGAAGYSAEYHVERYLRDVVMVRLWVGGPQLSSLDVARSHYSFNPW